MNKIELRKLLLVVLIRFVGYFLILSSLTMLVITFLPVVKEGIVFNFNRLTGRQFAVEKEKNAESKLPKAIITPIDTQFGIVIPKINANSRVVDNVDAGNEAVYFKALKNGVAHAAGTAHPGETGNAFLFAHSAGNFWEVSQYNAVFFLLGELKPGDEIFVFYHGKRFDYVMTDKKIVEANEVQFLNTQTNYPALTLQTCWPPGTALKRLLVFAKLVKT